MSSHYSTEPAPTASATLNTTLGPLHLALFAKQTPLTSKNFLQHCLDNYYTGTIFHRVVPDFVIQGGDPSGTGSGGTSIYEDPLFEYDPDESRGDEKIVLTDELHSRLRFNRRGLLGMAKSEDGSYGSQFFITLANTERELNGQCTLFGRVEGDSIFNVLKIAEAERVEGSERPVYPVTITSCEVGELGPLEGKLVKRQLTAPRSAAVDQEEQQSKKKRRKKGNNNNINAKALLSFGADDDLLPDLPPVKPIYREEPPRPVAEAKTKAKGISRKKSIEEENHIPKTPNPVDQLPLPDPEKEEPPLPEQEEDEEKEEERKRKASFLTRTNNEIEAMKNSMRRTTTTPSNHHEPIKKSALDAMIPETAVRGRKRQHGASADNSEALRMFNAFKAKLDNADSLSHHRAQHKTNGNTTTKAEGERQKQQDDEEEQVCDLHFIVNCQSCKAWNDDIENNHQDQDDESEGENWLTHQLRFGKDSLGKDLSWKREHPDDVDSLMVIDPREKEKEILGRRQDEDKKKSSTRMSERDRERERKLERIRH